MLRLRAAGSLLLALVVALTLSQAGSAGAGKGVIAGKILMPRDIGAEAYKYWHNYELTKAIATSLAESLGALGAYHDNYADDTNTILSSRDCGLFQDNIPASKVGTDVEWALRTESYDEAIWRPVLENNVRHAFDLYSSPWTGGHWRFWQPWVAYTTGWATFPEWWVWHRATDTDPNARWLATGRYIQRAIAGQMNLHIVILKDWTPEQALSYAQRYADHFGVKDTLYINSDRVLTWRVPPKPTKPPADGIGPRPIPNDGI